MPSLPRCPLITVPAGVTGYTAGMAKSVGTGRERGHIRKRGNSYQVLLYAGVDPLTGRELRMVESTTDRAEATRILNRMRAEVQAQQHARTRATLGAALDAWLRVHEAEETTLDGYHGYVRRCVTPALGDVPLSKVTTQLPRSSTPSSAGAGTGAAMGNRVSTTGPPRRTSAGPSATGVHQGAVQQRTFMTASPPTAC